MGKLESKIAGASTACFMSVLQKKKKKDLVTELTTATG